ncbi:MAG: hypothetical protein WB755_11990 [Terriglobales bacterium]|jgi:hypothetical protein
MNFFLTSADIQLLETITRQARTVPADDLPEFLGKLETARVTAMARLAVPTAASEPDRLLGIREASERLNLSAAYLYRHSDQLPFTVRQGRKLLFSSSGISKFISKNQNGGR